MQTEQTKSSSDLGLSVYNALLLTKGFLTFSSVCIKDFVLRIIICLIHYLSEMSILSKLPIHVHNYTYFSSADTSRKTQPRQIPKVKYKITVDVVVLSTCPNMAGSIRSSTFMVRRDPDKNKEKVANVYKVNDYVFNPNKWIGSTGATASSTPRVSTRQSSPTETLLTKDVSIGN